MRASFYPLANRQFFSHIPKISTGRTTKSDRKAYSSTADDNQRSGTSMLRMSVLPDSGLRVKHDDFKTAVNSLTEETFESLNSIWNEAGYEEVECQGLLGDILTKFKTLCAAELSAEQQILDHAKQQVVVKIDEYGVLCEKLGRTCGEEADFGSNFADRLAELEKRIYDIEVEISERSGQITAKADEINNLITALGEEGPPEFEGKELSDARIESMTAYCEGLESARALRVKEVREVAEDCLKACQELMVPEEGIDGLPQAVMYSDLDQAILNMKPGVEFPFVHKDDFQRLITRAQTLAEEKDRRRQELSSNGAEIARMWTQLRVSIADRTTFQQSINMNLSMETLKKGRNELDRLRALRLSSLSTVIACIRDDIAAYWDELGVTTPEQRQSEFPMFTAEIKELPDSSVEDHELFCVSLKEKVNVLRPILSKISRREAIIKERVELEHIMMDPERLRARGPKAREDRKREEEMSRRVKSLEKYTKEVLHQIELWEEQSGSPFLYTGERYVDRVNAQEEEYADTKNNLRNSRRKKDGKPEANASGKVVAKRFSSTLPASSNSLANYTPLLKKSSSNILATPSSASNTPMFSKSASTIGSTPSSGIAKKTPTTSSSGLKKTPAAGKVPPQKENQKVPVGAENIHKHMLERCNSLDSQGSVETQTTSKTEVKERGSGSTLERQPSETF